MWNENMNLTMLKAKIHRAAVTMTDLHYEGSISIDLDLLEQSGILPHEQVDVLNINNGERFTTYAIEAERGSRTIGINGAAARRAEPGDLVIICAFGQMDAAEAAEFQPTVLQMNSDNSVASTTKKSGHPQAAFVHY
jgi:aspartate 1-decarboxylase